MLYANPRGSTSYGEEFGNLIHHAYPSQDYDDLMAVVDDAIAEFPVDEERLYVGALGARGAGAFTAFDLETGRHGWRLDASAGDVVWARILGPREGAVVAVFGRAEDTEVVIASAADGAENGRVLVPIGPDVPSLSLDVAGIHLGPHLVTYTGTLQ